MDSESTGGSLWFLGFCHGAFLKKKKTKNNGIWLLVRFVPSLHSDHIAFYIPLPAVAVGKEKGTRAFKNECLEVLFAVCLLISSKLRTQFSLFLMPLRKILISPIILGEVPWMDCILWRTGDESAVQDRPSQTFSLLDKNTNWFEIYDFLHINWVRSHVLLWTGTGLGVRRPEYFCHHLWPGANPFLSLSFLSPSIIIKFKCSCS